VISEQYVHEGFAKIEGYIQQTELARSYTYVTSSPQNEITIIVVVDV
jgi:hypothetical protein